MPENRAYPRRLAVALAALATLAVSLVAGSSYAQDVADPDATVQQQADLVGGLGAPRDTSVAPKPRDGTRIWRQIGGARFQDSGGPDAEKSVGVTDFDDNLQAVAFRSERSGLVGGAHCSESSNPDAEKGCAPVLYRYTDTAEGGKQWRRVALPGGGGAGFIGAIAWIDNKRAMAVGGTGTFPRREPPYSADGQSESEPFGARKDQAGAARAWLMRADGSWCELETEASEDCPALPRDRDGKRMRGLTAVDFKPSSEPEVGFVGGLGQIARWQRKASDPIGGFDKLYDDQSPASDLTRNPAASILGVSVPRFARFRFRVRQIRFDTSGRTLAYAVTDGCCGDTPAAQASFMIYGEAQGPGGTIPARWHIDEALPGEGPESVYSLSTGLNRVNSPGGSPTDAVSVVATTAESAPVREEPSKIRPCAALRGLGVTPTTGSTGRPPMGNPAPREAREFASFSGARLHAIDGAVTTNPTSEPGNTPRACGAAPAWGVGEWRLDAAVGDGGGRRGMVIFPPVPDRAPEVWDIPAVRNDIVAALAQSTGTAFAGVDPGGMGRVEEWQQGVLKGSRRPTSPERIGANLASLQFYVDSYSLNALDVIGRAGVSYAVGDHGAIEIFEPDTSGTTGGGTEPDPPPVAPRGWRPVGGGDPYAGLGAVRVGRPGTVPPLAMRPRETLEGPRLFGWGTPDATREPSDISPLEDVEQIVMSRDGNEGWAIGANTPGREKQQFAFGNTSTTNGGATLHHFDGFSWKRCDAEGAAGELEPDPACARVRGLWRFEADGVTRRVPLVSLARVPLERDSNPKNDDDFEVVAIGAPYRGAAQPAPDDPVVLRYRDGRWDFEQLDARKAVTASLDGGVGGSLVLKDVAFTAPDDGWILARHQAGINRHRLFHYDGKGWTACTNAADSCGGPRVPHVESDATLRMTAAGDRVYLYGAREVAGTGTSLDTGGNRLTRVPLIIYRDRMGGGWTDGGAAGGGFDPAFQNPAPSDQGLVVSLAVNQDEDGRYRGWAVGKFFDGRVPPEARTNVAQVPTPAAVLMRLDGGGRWERFRDPGALEDYLFPRATLHGYTDKTYGAGLLTRQSMQVSMAGGRALIAQEDTGRLFAFDPGLDRWELVGSDRPMVTEGLIDAPMHGDYQALAPDGRGGVWAALRRSSETATPSQVFFYHYTDRPRRAVFEEVAHPFRDRGVRLTSLAAAANGTVWAATDSAMIARYDRVAGWEAVEIPGWEAGGLVTKTSPVHAVAVNAAGTGIAVGRGGRIADISDDSIELDPAAGRSCSAAAGIPCGTGRELRAAAVAPDGSALAGGENRTVLWRPVGEGFRALGAIPGDTDATITGIAMPAPDHAFLATDAGLVIAGTRSGGNWSWRPENLDADGGVVGKGGSLRATAVGASGDGYAVGDRGLVLRREPSGVWRRLRGPGTDELTSVALPVGGGDGVLIGGKHGLIWTGEGDRFEVARPGNYFRELRTLGDFDNSQGPLVGAVRGLALLPGPGDGETEAWAALEARGPATNRLLHYSSDPHEPLLNPGRGVRPLPDSPARRSGELPFAAFGKSDCDNGSFCPDNAGSAHTNSVLAERITDELAAERAARRIEFSVFTGDVTDSAGQPAGSTRNSDRTGTPGVSPDSDVAPRKLRRWGESVADRLAGKGVPLFGAIGPGDLSRPAYACETYTCSSETERAKLGENSTWRAAMTGRPAPWGGGTGARDGGLTASPAPGSDGSSVRQPDAEVGAGQNLAHPVRVRGGARTHYAVDVKRDGEPVARIVVVDSSLRSLQAGDGAQNPVESQGQQRWLERMLCFEGDTSVGGRCTRERGQRAIVVSNTPTYTYGPGSGATAQDGATLERVLLQYRASVVISGRLGWNGRYWATAPGLHVPCPGGSYRDEAPAPGSRSCADPTESLPGGGQPPAALAEALRPLDAPPPPVSDAQTKAKELEGTATGLLPFVVASGAGGKFGPNGENESASARDGFWHGHTIVRLAPDGDPAGVIVEQRPVFDWISLTGSTHVLRAGQRMRLRGTGRQPIAISSDSYGPKTRYAPIDSPAITHRYDLLEADPDKPYVPREDADGQYVPLDPDIGTIDPVTGAVKAGRGNYPRTYSIALLSVGKKAASYPIAFEPRKSFRPEPPARIAAPAIPRPSAAIRTLAQSPSIPPQPPAAGAPPTGASPSFPATPALPAPPPPFNATTPQPPAPPAPPPPPPPQLPTALDLLASPPSVPLAPQATVIPPPAPPIQPAPPGGARREARQRQAAVQKGEEGGGGGGEASQDIDLANGDNQPEGVSMIRRERDRPEPSITTIRRSDQPSAWARGALYGGGLTLFALAASLTWIGTRPGDRRKPTARPAPALARRPDRRL